MARQGDFNAVASVSKGGRLICAALQASSAWRFPMLLPCGNERSKDGDECEGAPEQTACRLAVDDRIDQNDAGARQGKTLPRGPFEPAAVLIHHGAHRQLPIERRDRRSNPVLLSAAKHGRLGARYPGRYPERRFASIINGPAIRVWLGLGGYG